jgi:hypothetical protein
MYWIPQDRYDDVDAADHFEMAIDMMTSGDEPAGHVERIGGRRVDAILFSRPGPEDQLYPRLRVSLDCTEVRHARLTGMADFGFEPGEAEALFLRFASLVDPADADEATAAFAEDNERRETALLAARAERIKKQAARQSLFNDDPHTPYGSPIFPVRVTPKKVHAPFKEENYLHFEE